MKKNTQATWVLEFHEVHPFNRNPEPDVYCLWFYRGEEERAPLAACMMDDHFPIDNFHELFYAWCVCPMPRPDWAAYYNVPTDELPGTKSKK